MSLIADQNVEHGDIRFRSFYQPADGQDFYARPAMGGLFDDDGIHFVRIGADSNKTFVGGSSVEPQVSEIPQKNALGGNITMKINHLAFVLQPYRAKLELAETCDFNNLLQAYATGTS